MRNEDQEAHPAAVERERAAAIERAWSKQRLVGSTLLGLLGLILLYRGDSSWGMAAVLLGFGIASIKDIKELRG
jgi:hypothetical protein